MATLPNTFCAFPFYLINITNDGKARLCCRTQEHISGWGRPLSLHSESFEEIWNSEYMRKTRRAMLAGEKLEACAGCYATEASGGASLRQIANAGATSILDAADASAMLALAEIIVAEHGAVAPPPAALHLWLGNLCNLKCGMCSPMFSSQIAADPVHSMWRGGLSRSELLLPHFRDGVSYRGFGDLVERGGVAAREVSMEGAALTLAGNGDPIEAIDIAGSKHPWLPCRLSLMAGKRRLARKWLVRTPWTIHVRPASDGPSPPRLEWSLQLDGPRQHLEIDSFRVTTRAAVGKRHPRELISRIPENPDWAKSKPIVFGEILAHAEHLRLINVSGGEPLINPVFPEMLEWLIDGGHAAHIAIYVTSNGTVYSPRLATLLKQFGSAHVGFSIDGVGRLQEFMRPPSKWDTVSRNVLAFLEDGVSVSVRPTVQAYNIFGLLDLVRLCERHRVPCILDNVLYSPRYLSLDMLPQTVVEEALADWLNYLEKECAVEDRWHVETVIAALQQPRPEPAELSTLQDEFIRFTNDLDQTRGQYFALANPELHRRLVAAGLDFQGKYRFAASPEDRHGS